MANKSTVLKGFNTYFFDFLDDVASIIENNEDILVSRSFFETVKKANPTLIIKSWYLYIYTPYKGIIDEGNVEYFLEKDYGKDISVLSNSEDIMNSINKIRAPIKSMSIVNQQHSMEYIQKLSKLSTMYNDA